LNPSSLRAPPRNRPGYFSTFTLLYPDQPSDVRALLAGSLLRQLAREGFAVRHEAGRLLVSPRDRLTPELTAWIKYLKAEVIAELESAEPR
jgi:hypothetical protein